MRQDVNVAAIKASFYPTLNYIYHLPVLTILQPLRYHTLGLLQSTTIIYNLRLRFGLLQNRSEHDTILLDQKIARIREQNEKIMRRKQVSAIATSGR